MPRHCLLPVVILMAAFTAPAATCSPVLPPARTLPAAACFPTGVWPPRLEPVPGNRRWHQLSVGNGHKCGRTISDEGRPPALHRLGWQSAWYTAGRCLTASARRCMASANALTLSSSTRPAPCSAVLGRQLGWAGKDAAAVHGGPPACPIAVAYPLPTTCMAPQPLLAHSSSPAWPAPLPVGGAAPCMLLGQGCRCDLCTCHSCCSAVRGRRTAWWPSPPPLT